MLFVIVNLPKKPKKKKQQQMKIPATYECEASNSGAATIIVSGLIAYGTIIGALFAN